MKQFEIEYIKLYKEEYQLINLTPGGDYFGLNAHSRETILKRKSTRQVVQYNILGEKIAESWKILDVLSILKKNPVLI